MEKELHLGLWVSGLGPLGVSAAETDLLRGQSWISPAPVSPVRGRGLFNEVQGWFPGHCLEILPAPALLRRLLCHRWAGKGLCWVLGTAAPALTWLWFPMVPFCIDVGVLTEPWCEVPPATFPHPLLSGALYG